MRKYFLGLFSLALAISFNVLQSNTPIKNNSNPTDQMAYDWYAVVDNKIASTSPVHLNKTKTQAIADDPCKNLATQICLFGTNEPVLEDQNVSSEPLDQLIKRTN